MLKLSLLLCLTLFLQANTIIYNGDIYTLDPQKARVQALVIDKEKIVFIGSNKEALEYKQENSTLIDAKGRFIMPGIIDSHTHTAIAALLFNTGLNLYQSKGKKGILHSLRKYKKENPDLDLYTGVGFYPYAFGPRGPSKEILDEIFPHSKAFFISNNGHQAWANSKAMEFLGIDANTPDPLPGMHYYVRNKKGEPTGFLIEGEAFWPHLKTLNIGTKDIFKKVLKRYLPQLSRQGITTVYDASIPAVQESAYQALGELDREEELKLRYFASHYLISSKDAKIASSEFTRLQKSYNTELFRVSSLKFVNDNSDDDNFAIQFEERELSQYLTPLLQANQDIMIHTSQDESVHQALNAIHKAKTEAPHSQSRITLAHVNMVRDSDFERFKAMDIIANIQPFDARGGGYYEYRYMLFEQKWENKLARYKHFFDKGITTSASSDYPACNKPLEECSPFHGMQIGITRQKVGAGAGDDILPSKKERLNLGQSIRAYTLNGAYQLHIEDQTGSLSPGKYADLIILDKDPFACDVYELHKLRVLRTMLKGKTVYLSP